MMDYILLGIALLAVLGIIAFLFIKLTPHLIPKNLSGFFFGILWTAIGITLAIFAALFLIKIFLG